MMNEELEQFEQRLSRQPVRPIPARWRAEILAVARQQSGVESRGREPRGFSPLVAKFLTVLWPHPQAWACLAAIWIFIFAVDFSIRDKTPGVTEKSAPPSPEVAAELRQQQRLLAELIGSGPAREAEAPKPFLPRPRSGRAEILTA